MTRESVRTGERAASRKNFCQGGRRDEHVGWVKLSGGTVLSRDEVFK
jgi:hypothetical protein